MWSPVAAIVRQHFSNTFIHSRLVLTNSLLDLGSMELSENGCINGELKSSEHDGGTVEQPYKMYLENTMERYSLGRVLGEGAFSVVRKARRKKDKLICALKIIDKKESGSIEFRNEIEILHKVDHPHCIAFYEWSEVF